VDALPMPVIEVVKVAGGHRFAERDVLQITMSSAAQTLYAELYTTELNDQSGGELVTALLERRAPVLRRLAMLFALCDHKTEVDVQHVKAAQAWTRYWTESVKFIFSDGAAELATATTNEAAQAIVEFLTKRKQATRSELSRDCFSGHKSKKIIDAALDELLTASPARIVVETRHRSKGTPGTPTKTYAMAGSAAKSANCANSVHSRGLQPDFDVCEVSEVCEVSDDPATSFRTLSTPREVSNQPQTRASVDASHNSHTSHADRKNAIDEDSEVL